ncbi:hypothetical protein ACJ72_03542 [Emergomyces africanus]|uniref:HhH-GPD domain-containing protein n=1 Tax=Emergomyces africanus TaxID=1955775 RepID=A0A1B7NZQ6_9EURO|nr:hypothetical protein ACJ72_03542 [Emergomyces africanus]
MAPRRSARVSAITQQAALDNTDSIETQPPAKITKTRQAGITTRKPTKTISKQAGGKGKKVSVSKAAAAAAAAAAVPANDDGPSATNKDASPSKTGLPRPTTTTGTLLEEAVAHLIKVAPQLRPVIEKHPCPLFSPTGLAEEINPFNSLVSGIIGQQVSGAAAKSIKKKFMELFHRGGDDDINRAKREAKVETAEMRYDRDDDFPTPEQVAKCDIATLRTAGLSQRKAEYIQGLAEKFASGELSARMLVQASDEEVVGKLIAVRGLGRWSVEMFSFFGLKRMDVFSTGDLGVQRGMAAFVGRDVSKLKAKGGGKFKYMSEKEMVEVAAPFSPYR